MKRTPSHVRKRLLFLIGLPLLLGSWASLAFSQLFILGIAWPAVREVCRWHPLTLGLKVLQSANH